MGLDLVEFVFAVEDAFAISIPNSDAETLTTPARLIDYLSQRLSAEPEPGITVTQRAFYRARDTIARVFAVDPRELLPDTELSTILPPQDRERAWLALRGAFDAKEWPPTPSDSFWSRLFYTTRTVGELAEHLVAYRPTRLLEPGERWTRQQIEEIVRQLVERQLGVSRDEYSLDSRFVQDLHIV